MPSGRFVNVTGTPASPQFASLVLNGVCLMSNGASQPDINVLHFRTNTIFPGGALATLNANIWGAINGPWQAVKSDSYTLTNSIMQYMDDPTSAKDIITLGVTGTILTDRSAAFNAGVIRKLSGLVGRSYRGSIHVGSLPESFTTKDQLNVTGLAAYDALIAAMGTWLAGVTDGVNLFYPIILSTLQSNLIANPSIFTGSYVTSFVRNLKVGTMKRRKEKSV